jgi:hypothetical protein
VAEAAVYFSLPSRRGAVAALYFLLPLRRGAAAAASTKRKFKKVVHLHKIFILKNAKL